MDFSIQTAEDLITFHHLGKLITTMKIAIRLGIFKCVGEETFTLTELSEKLRMNTDVLNCLLSPLIHLGLMEKEEDKIRNSNCAVQYLTGIRRSDLSRLLLYTARSDFNDQTFLSSADDSNELMVDAMQEGNRYTACYLASLLRSSEPLKVLDLGCGSGIFTNYLSKYSPRFTFDCVDREDVLKRLGEYLPTDMYKNRVITISGDISNLDIEKHYDLILMANILHFFPSAAIQNLLDHYGRLLEADGRLVICDTFSDMGNLNTLLISLEWLTKDSAFPTLDQMKTMLRQSGYQTILVEEPKQVVTKILICSKEEVHA